MSDAEKKRKAPNQVEGIELLLNSHTGYRHRREQTNGKEEDRKNR